jgi:TetR/AcrR family transcriptional repressor of nem operon
MENSQLARPREFDEAAVLDAAIQCFWAKGYEATSVRDLADEMGIAGASLYNAFGDKRALYRRALEQYITGELQECANRIESTLPPLQAIAALFQEVIAGTLSDKDRKGCMMVNTVFELVPQDKEFAKLLSDVLTQVEGMFYRLACAGQKDGTITKAQPAKDLARFLMSVLLGIRVLARVRPERNLLEGIARSALALLDRRLAH